MTRGWADSGVSCTRGLHGCTDISLCVCGLLLRMRRGPGSIKGISGLLFVPHSPVQLCFTKTSLCLRNGPRNYSDFICIFSSLSVCVCTLILVCVCVRACVWEREIKWVLCGCFLSISLHYVRKQRWLMWFAYYFLAIHEAWSVCQVTVVQALQLSYSCNMHTCSVFQPSW